MVTYLEQVWVPKLPNNWKTCPVTNRAFELISDANFFAWHEEAWGLFQSSDLYIKVKEKSGNSAAEKMEELANDLIIPHLGKITLSEMLMKIMAADDVDGLKQGCSLELALDLACFLKALLNGGETFEEPPLCDPFKRRLFLLDH